MIISLDRINDFLIKHKKRDERGSQGLWAMADQKDALAARLNSDITTRSHYFGERKSFYLDEKLISIYREWIDRLVDFCLYRHLTDLSHKNNWVSPNYMSTKGKGRFFAIRELYFNVPQYPFVFKTDIKSYYANIDTHILEKLIFKMGLPKSLQNLIAQDLFSSLDIRESRWREKGIFQGSSLSFFYAWVYLRELDDFFHKQKNIYYQRYKDDIIILAQTKGQLGRVKDVLYGILRKRKLTTRYKKTFEGETTAPISYTK